MHRQRDETAEDARERRKSKRQRGGDGGDETKIAAFINTVNREFARRHLAFERAFWDSYMGNKVDSTADRMDVYKQELEAFLNDPSLLENTVTMLASTAPTAAQRKVLEVFRKAFEANRIADPSAVAVREATVKMETALQDRRNTMALGYTDPASQKFVAASSVALATTVATHADEAVRKACFEGISTIGPAIVSDLLEIVKCRNALARKQGFADFYDYTVTRTEGFSKADLFEILDDLEAKTAPLNEACLQKIRAEKGDAAMEPWNFSRAIAGDLAKELDPYFAFDGALGAWMETFVRLGIDYRGATLKLDLCDRAGKYSNGFCHWPVNAYIDPSTGEHIPSTAGFTCLAVPTQIGSGCNALATLLHEGGHAAHMANITQNSPLFSHERPPSSVPYAETQSMFLESLLGDAAWLGRYAVSKEGETIPWELIERKIRTGHPLRVLYIRGMLAVPYFEKALYELPDAELTPEKVMRLAEEVELKIMGRRTSRPLLVVPHILSDESSCYYHGYVLAEMAVQQTRRHFLQKYGEIVDNPQVGADLAEVYWKPGNSISFMDAVAAMTGAPLSADAIVAHLGTDLENFLNSESIAYLVSVARGSRQQSDAARLKSRLNCHLQLVHGDEVIVSTSDGEAACAAYSQWLKTAFPPSPSSSTSSSS